MSEDKKDAQPTEKKITLGPHDVWVPDLPKGNQPELNKPKSDGCTCGVSHVGVGIHSDWCDKVVK